MVERFAYNENVDGSSPPLFNHNFNGEVEQSGSLWGS